MKNPYIIIVFVVVIILGWWLIFNKQTQVHHMLDQRVNELTKTVECPVMGSKIDPAKAYSSTVYKGKTYYFCCGGCPEAFKADPEKYINK